MGVGVGDQNLSVESAAMGAPILDLTVLAGAEKEKEKTVPKKADEKPATTGPVDGAENAPA